MIAFITKWIDKIARYIEMRFQLIRLSFVESVSGILSYFLFAFIALFFTLGLLIFLGMGLSEYFADLTGSRVCGHFMTAGVYLLFIVVLFLFRKNITGRLSGTFISMLTTDEDEGNTKDKSDSND